MAEFASTALGPQPTSTSIVPVLVYHEVSTEPDAPFRPYTATPAMLREHIRVLIDLGYKFVTVTEMATHLRAGSTRRIAAITFDDGLRSFASTALSILAEHHVPATMYVPTAWVGAAASWMGSAAPLMSWSELRDLDPATVEVGAHGHRHIQLDIAPLREAEHDIAISKALLEDELQREVASFAYPHGSFRRRVRDAVADAGFTAACAVKNAWSLRSSDLFALARMTITPGCDGRQLHDRLVAQSPTDPVSERLRTTVFREVRRARHIASRQLGDAQ